MSLPSWPPISVDPELSAEQRSVMYRGLPTKARLRRSPEELAAIEAALVAQPKDYYLWCARAALHPDPAVVIESYSRALAIRPFASHSLYNRGRKYLGADRYAEALADLQAATALDPDEGWKWHFLGVAQYFLGHYLEASATFQTAIEVHIRNQEPLTPFEVEWQWNCLVKLGDNDGAVNCLQATDELTPVADSEQTYKQRILLYRGDLTVETYVAGVDYTDRVEACNQLYGLANHLYYNLRDTAGSVARLREVVALSEDGAGWGVKMARLDLPEREAMLRGPSGHPPATEDPIEENWRNP